MKLLLAVLVLCGLVLADGGMVVPPGEEIDEYGQVAVVKFFEGREELLISTKFLTESSDFAWILPLPSEPAVDSVSPELFAALQEYCRPLYRGRSGFGCGFGGLAEGPGRWGDSLGVEELEQGIIGDYSYQVFWASGADTLVDYLSGHGYALPAGAAEVFGHYTAKGWHYFVVARVTDSTRWYESRNVGIGLSFLTDSLVYPLYISRVGSGYSGVVLYLFCEHRQMFSGAELRFSGRVGPRTFAAFPDLLDRECHLTKLRKYFYRGEMSDIYPRDAPDDKEFRPIEHYGGWGFGGLEFVLLAAIVFAVKRKRSRSGRA